jgi:hypothetical protein
MIAERYAKGETLEQLAEDYECGVATVWRALRPFEQNASIWGGNDDRDQVKAGGMTNHDILARQRISETLLRDLTEVWEAHGKIILEKLAVTDPAKLATIAYGLLPRDIFVRVEDNTTIAGDG